MALKNSVFVFIVLMSVMAVSTARVPEAQPTGEAWLLGCPADQGTMVRFFFNPEGADYFHTPLVFQVVPADDPRLNTGPITREGRTTYITREEMKAMLRALAHSGASWSVSSKVKPLGDAHSLVGSYGFYLRIRVVCSKGTACGRVEPAEVCSTLAPLDSVLKTPRALWEFQALRIGYRCKVPGFNWDAYPDRRP
jgi:hypothetical protein